MKNLYLLVVVAVGLSACAPKHSGVDIQHSYIANSMSCNPGGPTTVPDRIVFSNGKVTEGNCSADYTLSSTEITISNLVGACTALPNFTSQPNSYNLATSSDTGLVYLSFEQVKFSTGGCSISMYQAD